MRTLGLHKYTPNFEGMSWKEMAVMDEQALEARSAGCHGARPTQEDVQDVRDRQEEDGHRRSHGAAAADSFCACTTDLGDVREREW